METVGNNFRGEEFWRTHFLKAAEFSGTNEQYCAANGLSVSSFQNNKKRLGFTRASKKRNAFVKIARVQDKAEEPVKSINQKRLPDAKWLGEFVKVLLG